MYKIMGSDQREYGPVASGEIREWIAQGRANAQTLASFEGAPWKPLSTFPEFADVLRTAAPPPFAPPLHSGAAQKTNTVAVAGLVFSVLGLCCLPFSLIGLVMSIIGFLQIQKNPQAYTTGKIVPIIGIILALLDLVLTGVAISSGAFEDLLRSLPR